MLSLNFPIIDPVALHIGPFHIHWYGIAYAISLLICLKLTVRHAARVSPAWPPQLFDRFMTYAIIGIVIGGRLGHILFFNPLYYFENFLEIFMVWKGGMAFHGGFLGFVGVTLLFCTREKIQPLIFGDIICLHTPIGLFLGRIANFINGELYGIPTSQPWGVFFPGVIQARHPTQIYEALTEGLLLYLLLHCVWKRVEHKPGALVGVFLTGYGTSRFMIEFLKEPELLINCWFLSLSMGQILCLPMIGIGTAWIIGKTPRFHIR